MFLKIFIFTFFLSSSSLVQADDQNINQCDDDCYSQPVVPILQVKSKCPITFFASEGYCIPFNKKVKGIIPIFNNKFPEKCPFGFKKNNGYCQASGGNTKNVIPKIGNYCPKKYTLSNNYCVKKCL